MNLDNRSESRKNLLLERKKIITAWNNRKIKRKRLVISMGLLLISLGIFFKPLMSYSDLITTDQTKTVLMISSVSVFYGFIVILSALIIPQNLYKTDLQEIENELDLLSIALSSEEERAEKLFKHHHVELKKYYDENLKQSSWIFIVGIICIVVGFSIIVFTLYLLYNNLSSQIENKIIIASIGAIGAILTNFIAVVFLKMHAETIKSLTEFHNRFVNTHHLYFGNFLVSKVKSETKREEALINLALSINTNDNSASTLRENELP